MKELMKKELSIRVENQYGNFRNFPSCAASQELIKLTGRKTFHESDLAILRDAGFTIKKTEEQRK